MNGRSEEKPDLMLRVLFVALLSLSLSVTASNAQHMNQLASPCAKTVITSELVACLTKARSVSDAKLNSLYRRLREKLDPDDLKKLAETQRLWIQYRDANCTAERALYGNATAQAPAYLACLEAMTRSRTRELAVTYAVALK